MKLIQIGNYQIHTRHDGPSLTYNYQQEQQYLRHKILQKKDRHTQAYTHHISLKHVISTNVT